MARRSGTADLPLHGGHVPRLLADRMTALGAVIAEAIVHHYGRDELLRRLAHPFKSAVRQAKLGREEKLAATRRLDAQARRLEAGPPGMSFDGVVARERERSASYGGRSIFGWEPGAAKTAVAERAS